MNHLRIVTIAAAVFTPALSGCAMSTDFSLESDSLDDTGAVDLVAQSIDSSWTTAAVTVNQNQELMLQPANTHVCVLAKVQGHFLGNGESIRVYSRNGYWWLKSTSGQSGVQGKARCYRMDGFMSPTSDRFHHNWEKDLAGPNPNSCSPGHTTSLQLWQGDSFNFLSGIRGAFNGFCEKINVGQPSSGTAWSNLHLKTGQSEGMTGWATSFYAGQGEFVMPVDTTIKSITANPVQTNSVWLGLSATTMCALIGVSGELNGNGEWVEIDEASDSSSGGQLRWRLRARSGSGYGVTGWAKCLYRDQFTN